MHRVLRNRVDGHQNVGDISFIIGRAYVPLCTFEMLFDPMNHQVKYSHGVATLRDQFRRFMYCRRYLLGGGK